MLAAEREITIVLAAGSHEARDACRSALRGLGWMLGGDSDCRLEAHEDPIGLNCRTTPSSLEIELVAPSDDETVVRISGSAPGIGPVPRRRLARQLAALTRRLTAVTQDR